MQAEPMHNLEAERYILGSIFKDNFCMDSVVGFTPEDFYTPIHQDIFSEMQTLSDKGQPIDPATVGDALRKAGKLVSEEEEDLAGELMQSQYTTVHIKYHAEIVKRHSIRRKLKQAALLIANETECPQSADDMLDTSEKILLAVRERSVQSGTLPLQHYLHQTLDAISEMEQGCDKGIESGLVELDKHVSMRPGQLIIIAARPGGGKSICGMQFGVYNALHGRPVVFYSLEMSGEELAARAISSYGSVNANYVTRKRKALDGEQEKLESAVADLSRIPLFINDRAWNTYRGIASDARRMKRKHKVEMIVIDYLQLVETVKTKGQLRHEEIGDITKGLKNLAKELGIPVILLAQLNRDTEKVDKEPQLWNIKESGSAEQDADVVLLLWTSKELGKDNIVNIKVAKNRQGIRDVVIEVYHAKQFMKFCPPGVW